MAAKDLTKDEITLIADCIDRAIRGDKVAKARATSPLLREVYDKQENLLRKVKDKLTSN